MTHGVTGTPASQELPRLLASFDPSAVDFEPVEEVISEGATFSCIGLCICRGRYRRLMNLSVVTTQPSVAIGMIQVIQVFSSPKKTNWVRTSPRCTISSSIDE